MVERTLKPETMEWLQSLVDRAETAINKAETLIANDKLTIIPELGKASLGLCQAVKQVLEGEI